MFSTLKMSSTQRIVMVFLHLKILSTQRIYTPVQVFYNFFIELYIALCNLTKKMFFTLENVIYPKNTLQCFSLKNIYLWLNWLKWCFLHKKMCSTWRIVMVFLHLKILSTRRIYTPVLQFFQWLIYTFVRVDKFGVFYTWKIYLSVFQFFH